MGPPLSIMGKLLQYGIELGAGVFIKIAFYILRVESTLFRFIIALNFASDIFE
jgi:multisubunit Na+/H+ antiporter MnhC subunit